MFSGVKEFEIYFVMQDNASRSSQQSLFVDKLTGKVNKALPKNILPKLEKNETPLVQATELQANFVLNRKYWAVLSIWNAKHRPSHNVKTLPHRACYGALESGCYGSGAEFLILGKVKKVCTSCPSIRNFFRSKIIFKK